MDETNKINKITVNGVEYDIEDVHKATKNSELVNDTKYVNESYIQDMAITNSELLEIFNALVK